MLLLMVDQMSDVLDAVIYLIQTCQNEMIEEKKKEERGGVQGSNLIAFDKTSLWLNQQAHHCS